MSRTLTRVQNRETKLRARPSKAEAACGRSAASGTSDSTGSGGNTGTTAG
jgi:hypothetical protein